MKFLRKVILLLSIILITSSISAIDTYAILDIFGDSSSSTIDIPNSDKIEENSIELSIEQDSDLDRSLTLLGFRVLSIIKYIVMAILVLMIIYTGIMMVNSMGKNEEELKKTRSQLWYYIVAMLFINVPSVLLNTVYKGGEGTLGGGVGEFTDPTSGDNLIFNFGSGLVENVVWFLQVAVYAVALFMFVYAGIQLISARGREEKMTEAKNKLVYSVLALVFAGIIETWKRIAYSGSIEEGRDLFESLANLALFFAAPVTIFCLALAAFYMITANGEEERVKKAKTILLSTAFGVFILLASYTILIQISSSGLI